ncbi:MAG: SurA N-terminal domain-containing protein [Deltaproteobacteria bacterium]|nr:SurA N-terminal domain-containing protein [Deltaproteobacteria bacterium]
MLKLLRKHSRSWVIAVAIGAIVIVFIFWGIGGMGPGRFDEVARVNGEPIFRSVYNRQYNQMVREFQERAKGELTEEQFKALGLKERALNLLIDEMLMRQAAERLGLDVSTSELRDHIRGLPYFQEDGKFSERRYQAILTRVRVKPAEFESGERQNLLYQKVIQTITGFAKVSEGELQEMFRLMEEEVEVDYLVVSPEAYLAKQTPSEPALTSYYQEHQKEFQVPDRVRIRYMLFLPQDFAGAVKTGEKEVDEYIQEHESDFTRPKVIRVQEVFLPVPAKAAPVQKQELEKKAKDLLQQARTGADFAKLAEAHSQDSDSRKKGGDLGDVKRGDKPAAWEKTAFSLSPGEVGLAQTPQGYHVIKMTEIKEKERLPEPEARALAAKKLREEKSRDLAKETAQRARGEVTAANFVETAKKYNATLKETPLFAMGDQIAGLELPRSLKQAALGLKVDEISKVLDAPGGFAIIHCQERQEAHVPPFDKVKEQVRLAVSRQQAKTLAEKEAETLLQRLQKGESVAKVAADAKVSVQSSGWFKRSEGFLKQPLAQPLTTAAFQLSQQNPYPAKPVFWKDKYYLLAFKGRRAPSPEEFKKQEEKLRQQVLEQKRRLLFEAWLAKERQSADIKIIDMPS